MEMIQVSGGCELGLATWKRGKKLPSCETLCFEVEVLGIDSHTHHTHAHMHTHPCTHTQTLTRTHTPHTTHAHAPLPDRKKCSGKRLAV